jgi:hypothetical protein
MVHANCVKRLAGGVLCLAFTSCGSADPDVPWETPEMIRELTTELRQFEGLPSEFSDAMVLAWRIDARPALTSTPRIPVPGGIGFMPTNPDQLERRWCGDEWAPRARQAAGHWCRGGGIEAKRGPGSAPSSTGNSERH